ncbi:MAG: hypothetical protein PUK83_00525 [Clostridia bacterium]|nr:hypothetical protein [Clostridia bacterium]MDY5263927.1 hypothetical protein [Eubacteriales bacterium]
MDNIQPILGAIFTGVPVVLLAVAIARYNIYNKHNVLLHVFGILTILAGGVLTGEKICQIITPQGFLGYSGGIICFSAFIALLLAYAVSVNVFMEIQLKEDNRPAILGTAILAFIGFVFYAVNSIFNVIGYNVVVEYCVYIVVMLCSIGIYSEKNKLQKYCKKNSIEYNVLTSRKKDDIEYNKYWISVEQALQKRRELVLNKATYNKIKGNLTKGEVKLDELQEAIDNLYNGLTKRDIKKMHKQDKKNQKAEEKQEKLNKKAEKKQSKKANSTVDENVLSAQTAEQTESVMVEEPTYSEKELEQSEDSVVTEQVDQLNEDKPIELNNENENGVDNTQEQQSEVNSDEIVVTNADENTEIEKDEKESAVTGVDEQSTESEVNNANV